MAQRYGPVELHLVGFDGERPDPSVIAALVDLLEGGLIRLLDFVIISKDADGEVTVTEIEDETDKYGFGGVELAAVGITGDEDVEEFAQLIPAGSSAALVAFELAYARDLAAKLEQSGAAVLRTERIPAPVVNEIMQLADEA